MKRSLRISHLFLAGWLLVSPGLPVQAQPGRPKLALPYGNNPAAGAYLSVHGIKLYYEVYGSGPPMLQVHGNGLNIASMRHQISFFAPRYKVIAADSRGHGKSELGEGRLTYEQMSEDLNALLTHLGLNSVCVLGWSDGGIIALLLAIHHPDKVSALAIMGANLDPAGAYDWARQWVARQEQLTDRMLASGDTSQPWVTQKQHLGLLGAQPNISLAQVRRITAPTLVMAGDRDVIRGEHTLQLFENLPKAQLCIFPGATHMMPSANPALFNQTVAAFFEHPNARPDTRDLFR